ncbi:hypothetical protein [Streptococcus sp. S784/96/1]|uniref:hypothetical protein n=1 Tax=Streptococcus sp. S784/96/1 TaxID=2653499 RepID=UPI0013868764|nr:hypothetical protein [Streptococcus sp. S784/96/1]
MALVGNPVTWIVSGFLLFLLLMMAFFLGFASQPLIQQDEFELTKAYTHMTWEDAEQTRTSEKGITYYTKIDEVMAYMNSQFQDYALEDRISVLPPSSTYKDYLSTLWQDLNGGDSLKTMAELYNRPLYQLSKEEQDDLSKNCRRKVSMPVCSNLRTLLRARQMMMFAHDLSLWLLSFGR